MRHLTPVDKARILALDDLGISPKDIAKDIGFTASTIRRHLPQLQETRDPNLRKPRPGRPRYFNARKSCIAARAITSGRVPDATQLQREYFPDAGATTVRRELRRLDLPGRVRRRKPMLQKTHKLWRKIWAKIHAKWEVSDWERVWWSDESKFNLVGSDGRRWCRRRVGEEFLDRNVHKAVKHGGGKVNVWGVISWHGVGRLHRVTGNLTAHQFVQILDQSLLGSLEDTSTSKHDIIFQQDNDPKHTSKLGRAWFSENGNTLLPWAPSSPDMNPIEHVWNVLDRKVRSRPILPQNAEELWLALEEEWYKLDVQFIRKLISSMPRRVAALQRAHGEYTRY